MRPNLQGINELRLPLGLKPVHTTELRLESHQLVLCGASTIYVAVGGTFDRLHPGHRVLLTTAMLASRDKVHIAVTAPSMLQKKKYKELVQPYLLRENIVRNFIENITTICGRREDANGEQGTHGINLEISELIDELGEVDGRNKDVDCLIVSEETKGCIPLINQIREQKSSELKKMNYIIVPL
ncbi:MAG: pantetheine-phosphate adenylyltransferase, partial [Streblomastix strix]